MILEKILKKFAKYFWEDFDYFEENIFNFERDFANISVVWPIFLEIFKFFDKNLENSEQFFIIYWKISVVFEENFEKLVRFLTKNFRNYQSFEEIDYLFENFA